VPFLLALGEGARRCYVSGALDALLEEPGGRLAVVDFKYAVPRPEAAERYRAQLAAYVLAVARARPGAAVSARLQFLRGDQRAVDVTPSPEALARFEAEAPALGAAAARGEAPPSPAALGRDRARCRAEGCGFVGRCFGPDPSRLRSTGRLPEDAGALQGRAGGVADHPSHEEE
jgi:hypothetical protein